MNPRRVFANEDGGDYFQELLPALSNHRLDYLPPDSYIIETVPGHKKYKRLKHVFTGKFIRETAEFKQFESLFPELVVIEDLGQGATSKVQLVELRCPPGLRRASGSVRSAENRTSRKQKKKMFKRSSSDMTHMRLAAVHGERSPAAISEKIAATHGNGAAVDSLTTSRISNSLTPTPEVPDDDLLAKLGATSAITENPIMFALKFFKVSPNQVEFHQASMMRELELCQVDHVTRCIWDCRFSIPTNGKIVFNPPVFSKRDMFVLILMNYCPRTLSTDIQEESDKQRRDLVAGLYGDYLGFSHSKSQTIMRQLIETISRIHRANIIHGDMKPNNIMIDDDDNITIIDLGRASYINSHFGPSPGTKEYSAPNSSFRSVVPQDDWWGLWIIMLEITTFIKLEPEPDNFTSLEEACAFIQEKSYYKLPSQDAQDVLKFMFHRLATSSPPSEVQTAPRCLDSLFGGLCSRNVVHPQPFSTKEEEIKRVEELLQMPWFCADKKGCIPINCLHCLGTAPTHQGTDFTHISDTRIPSIPRVRSPKLFESQEILRLNPDNHADFTRRQSRFSASNNGFNFTIQREMIERSSNSEKIVAKASEGDQNIQSEQMRVIYYH